jgi:hypothetical protein
MFKKLKLVAFGLVLAVGAVSYKMFAPASENIEYVVIGDVNTGPLSKDAPTAGQFLNFWNRKDVKVTSDAVKHWQVLLMNEYGKEIAKPGEVVNGSADFLFQAGATQADGSMVTLRINLGHKNLKKYAIPASLKENMSPGSAASMNDVVKLDSTSKNIVIRRDFYDTFLQARYPVVTTRGRNPLVNRLSGKWVG